MALFDIFDEISEKQVIKTEFGEERIFGVMVGIVAENYSEEMPGRLCVNIPVRDKEANQLKWAKMAFGYMGAGYGMYFLPEKNDQVLLAFEDGNIEKPYVIGCIPRDKDKFLKKSATEKNDLKQIQTKNGTRIAMKEGENEDGSQDVFSIITGGESHQLVIDNEKKVISLKDKEGNCSLEMATEKGQIRVHAEKKLEITVGDNISILMNGSNGTVKIEAQKLMVEAGKTLSLETDGKFKAAGKEINMEAVSTYKASSSGAVIMEGKPIKLG